MHKTHVYDNYNNNNNNNIFSERKKFAITNSPLRECLIYYTQTTKRSFWRQKPNGLLSAVLDLGKEKYLIICFHIKVNNVSWRFEIVYYDTSA